MTTRYPSCSKASSERSNPQAEASPSEPVSRNASKLDSASLRVVGSDQSSGLAEVCHRRRSDTCMHSSGSPGWLETAHRKREVEEPERSIRAENARVGQNRSAEEVGRLHSSEERPNQPGAKGGDCKSATIEKLSVLDRMIRYTPKVQSWRWKLNPERVTFQKNLAGKPDAGNPHVRFDEGECRDWLYRRPAFSTLPGSALPLNSIF